MERIDSLLRQKQLQESGLRASQALLDHGQERGFSEKAYPSAKHLHLGVDPKIRFANLLREETGVLAIQRRITEVVIPKRLAKIENLALEIANYPIQSAEDLVKREEIFTQEQATLLAAAILQKNGREFVAPNLRTLFIFELDKDIEPILHHIANLSVNVHYSTLDDPQKLALRNQTLNELNMLLNNPAALNQALDNHKLNNISELLIWLSEQNDKFGGKFCELLVLQPFRDIRRLSPRYQKAYFNLPSDLSRYLRPILDPQPAIVPNTDQQDIVVDPSVQPALPALHDEPVTVDPVYASYAEPQQSRNAERAAQIQKKLTEELKPYMRKVLQAPHLQVLSSSRQITLDFNFLTDSVIKWMENQGYVKVAGRAGRKGTLYLYTLESIALMLFVVDRRRAGGVNDREFNIVQGMAGELKKTVQKELEEEKKEKKGPANGS